MFCWQVVWLNGTVQISPSPLNLLDVGGLVKRSGWVAVGAFHFLSWKGKLEYPERLEGCSIAQLASSRIHMTQVRVPRVCSTLKGLLPGTRFRRAPACGGAVAEVTPGTQQCIGE